MVKMNLARAPALENGLKTGRSPGRPGLTGSKLENGLKTGRSPGRPGLTGSKAEPARLGIEGTPPAAYRQPAVFIWPWIIKTRPLRNET